MLDNKVRRERERMREGYRGGERILFANYLLINIKNLNQNLKLDST
jgi:hypothetical protein